MKTITLQIGHPDNELTQKEWSEFFNETHGALAASGVGLHFSGCAAAHLPWQNACWVFVATDAQAEQLRRVMALLREKYRQDSVAWTEGETAFV